MLRLVLLLCFLNLPVWSQQYVPVQDFSAHWLTVDRSGEQFTPYVMGNSLNYPMIGIMINTSAHSGLVLESCVPVGTAIFVDNKIVTRTQATGCLYYSIDSLGRVHQKDELFISFFNENLQPQLLTTRLMTEVIAQSEITPASNTAQIKKRVVSGFMDFFIVALIITLGLYAYLVNRFPRVYRDFFNFSKAFAPTLKEEKVLTQRNVATANGLFLLGYSLMIAMLMMLFWKMLGGIPQGFGFMDLQSFRGALISWLTLSVLVYATIGFKYLLIRILCNLLNVARVAAIHFFDFMRLSMIFVTATLLAVTLFYLGDLNVPTITYQVALYIFMALLIVRIVVILLKLIGGSAFRKVHLISYLCTTEILPLLVGFRILF